MNLIDSLFQRLRAEKRAAFMPFVTAGDPDIAFTRELLPAAAEAGADLFEVGFPFSDPIADGPVIQASYTRALAAGIHLDDMFSAIREIADSTDGSTPLVGMVSFSIVHRRGRERFVRDAAKAGLSGLIVPDLPMEESPEFGVLASERDLKLIQLVTPTTPLDRALRIAAQSTGFLYCVSVTGITGEREQLPFQVRDLLVRLREKTSLPLCVGFGISRPEHVTLLREYADGVIVGSAIVRRMERVGEQPLEEAIDGIRGLAASLIGALNP
jgi:tryptophan synthase alpha chain